MIISPTKYLNYQISLCELKVLETSIKRTSLYTGNIVESPTLVRFKEALLYHQFRFFSVLFAQILMIL